MITRLALSLFTALISAAPVLAAGEDPTASGGTSTDAGSYFQTLLDTVNKLLTTAQDLMWGLAAILAVGVIVLAGVYYIMGNVEFAKKAITAGIIGLLIVSCAYLIIMMVIRYTPQA